MDGNIMVMTSEKHARRAQIEMRIEMHRDAAAGSLLEIGRQRMRASCRMGSGRHGWPRMPL